MSYSNYTSVDNNVVMDSMGWREGLQDKRPHGQKATDKRPQDKTPQLPIYTPFELNDERPFVG